MVQFKDALTGVEKRDYVRAVDYQRCLRVAGKHNDFEEVGRTPRHHTLFEMLGNWSFGDYFKREAIHWAWQFLTRDLQDPAPSASPRPSTRPTTSPTSIWKDEIGLPPERLVRWGDFPAGDEANWWRMGDVGPVRPLLASSTTTAAPTSPRARVRPGPQRALPALARGLEPRVHGVRAPPGSQPDAAAGPRRGHGHGPRADRRASSRA